MTTMKSIFIKSLAIPLVVILSFSLLLALFEVALRLIGLGNPLIYRENVLYGYELIENQKERRQRGATVTINHKGLRSTTDWDGKNKILFVGDSVTYGGSYIDDAEIFSEIACAKLRAGAHKHAICGNAGTNAYGVRNMLRRIDYGPVQDADVVVITVIAGDFFRGMHQLSSLPFFSKRPMGWFRGSEEVVAFLTDTLRSKLRWQRPHGPSNLLQDEMQELDMVVQDFKMLTDQLKAKGKAVVVVWSPSRNSVADRPEAVEKLVRERFLAAMAQTTVIDMSNFLRSVTGNVFYDEDHLERAGHAIYGEVLAEVIQAYLK
jgi:hypothetical protein